jgi:hypothetical protein
MANEEDWHAEANVLVDLARGFYGWAPFPAPRTIGILEGLIDDVMLPGEPDPEPDDYWGFEPEPYWTIERMFEDL